MTHLRFQHQTPKPGVFGTGSRPDSAGEVCDKAYTKWRTKRKVTRALIGLVVSIEKEKMPGPSRVDKNNFIDAIVQKAYEQHKARITKNNGVKEKNLIELLFPVGFLDDELDPALLATLNSFGNLRGDTAHRGLFDGLIKKEVDPKTEKDTVDTIIAGLKNLDQKFASLAR